MVVVISFFIMFGSINNVMNIIVQLVVFKLTIYILCHKFLSCDVDCISWKEKKNPPLIDIVRFCFYYGEGLVIY